MNRFVPNPTPCGRRGASSLAGRRRLRRAGLDRSALARWLLQAAPTPAPTCWPKAAALPGQSEACRLPVHERCAQPGRHVRPQAGAHEIQRHALQGRHAGRLERPADRPPDAVAVRRSASTARAACEISSLFPHTAQFADDLCVIRSMYTDTAAHASGCLQMNTGSVADRQAEPGLVAELRPGHREREPAELRGDDRSRAAARSAAPRTGRRATCRPPIRARCSAAAARRCSIWPRPPGISRSHAAPTRSICSKS